MAGMGVHGDFQTVYLIFPRDAIQVRSAIDMVKGPVEAHMGQRRRAESIRRPTPMHNEDEDDLDMMLDDILNRDSSDPKRASEDRPLQRAADKSVRICVFDSDNSTYVDVATVHDRSGPQVSLNTEQIEDSETETLQLFTDMFGMFWQDVWYRNVWQRSRTGDIEAQGAMCAHRVLLPGAKTFNQTKTVGNSTAVLMDAILDYFETPPFIAIYTMLIYTKNTGDLFDIIAFVVCRFHRDNITQNEIKRITDNALLEAKVVIRLSDTDGMANRRMKKKYQMGCILAKICPAINKHWERCLTNSWVSTFAESPTMHVPTGCSLTASANTQAFGRVVYHSPMVVTTQRVFFM